jgi:hypothetical protein
MLREVHKADSLEQAPVRRRTLGCSDDLLKSLPYRAGTKRRPRTAIILVERRLKQ